jgi:molybdopterin-guanine dinucleotide biosynthesis protein A
VLAAVLVRTRRLVHGTIWALLFAAVAGLVTGATAAADDRKLAHDHVRTFPDWMLTVEPGVSPLWHSAAYTCSALLLLLLYGARRPRRRPYEVLPAIVAVIVVLVLVPVSDHAPGRFTTASDCVPQGDIYAYGYVHPPPLTGERAFICEVRTSDALPYHANMPDHLLVAYGRRLCGAYTRDDPRETARFRQAHGVDVRGKEGLLAHICPKADETFKAAIEKEEREIRAAEAEEQDKCDKAPRRRPLIKPVSAIKQRQPVSPWSSYALGGRSLTPWSRPLGRRPRCSGMGPGVAGIAVAYHAGMQTAAGVVLAGGRSTRMGEPKAGLEWHGSTLLYRAGAMLARTVDGPVVVVAAPGQDLPPLPAGVTVVEDPVEGLGPMQGLAVGLAAVADRAETAFVCSTDLPFLHPAFVRCVLRRLAAAGADVALPVARGFRQPLAAGYRTALAGLIADLLAEGNLRPGMLFKHCEVAQFDDAQLLEDAALARHDPTLESVVNINTPEDYAAARERPAPEIVAECFGALARNGGHRPRTVRAATLGEAAASVGLALDRHVVAALNGDQVTRDERLPLVAGDTVSFLSADAGG